MGDATKIYVGNIPFSFREQEISDEFSKIGPLVNCSLKQGYAFIEFENADDAKEAIREMHDKELDGRRIRVEASRPMNEKGGRFNREGPESRHLFVANIPSDASQTEIEDYFATYGKVEGVKVLPQRGGANALSAFVDFAQVEDAIKVYDSTLEFNGNNLRTDYNIRSSRPAPRRFDDRRRDDRYDDRRSDRYDDRRRDDRRNDRYDDRRNDRYDDRRNDRYDDRRNDRYDDRRNDRYDDRRNDRYDDRRNDRYDDRRSDRYDDRRNDRHDDRRDDRYNDRRDDRNHDRRDDRRDEGFNDRRSDRPMERRDNRRPRSNSIDRRDDRHGDNRGDDRNVRPRYDNGDDRTNGNGKGNARSRSRSFDRSPKN